MDKLDEAMQCREAAEIESALSYFDKVIPPEKRLKKERQLVDEAKALAQRIRQMNGNILFQKFDFFVKFYINIFGEACRRKKVSRKLNQHRNLKEMANL